MDRVPRRHADAEHAAQGRLATLGPKVSDRGGAPGRGGQGWRCQPRSSPTSSAPSVRSSSGRRNRPAGYPSIRADPPAAGGLQVHAAPIPFRDFPSARRGGSVGAARRATARTARRDPAVLQGRRVRRQQRQVLDSAGSSTPDSTYLPAPGDLPYEPPRSTSTTTIVDRAAHGALLQGGSAGGPGRTSPRSACGRTGRWASDRATGADSRSRRYSWSPTRSHPTTCSPAAPSPATSVSTCRRSCARRVSRSATRSCERCRSTHSPIQGDGRGGGRPPRHTSILREVMRRAQPKVILTLGANAARVAADERARRRAGGEPGSVPAHESGRRVAAGVEHAEGTHLPA